MDALLKLVTGSSNGKIFFCAWIDLYQVLNIINLLTSHLLVS